MIRKAIVSGQFYNADKEKLKNEINKFLQEAKIKKLNKKIMALISPHAGYFFSGKCAAHGYKLLKESKQKYDSFLILGVNHTGIGKTSISLKDFETPLGIVKNDIAFSKKLVDIGIEVNELAHSYEHSIEVQLPFLQVIYDKIKFVPLIVSDDYEKYIDKIKEIIKNKNICIIASSDFTHYGSNYSYVPFSNNVKENLYRLDNKAIEFIKNLDIEGFNGYIKKTNTTICGRFPISLLLNLIKGKNVKGELLSYYTSGDVVNDYRNAVGYGSIAF